MTVSVALLRGINVGGHRKVPMATLAAMFAELGYENIFTYIQSGNVVFGHRSQNAELLRSDLEARIASTFGFDVAVILRSSAELTDIVVRNPYPGVEATTLHVLFFAEDVPVGALDAIDPEKFAPEKMSVSGREIYLHLPDGMGRAKLPAAVARLTAPATARNWRTVEKLLELASPGGTASRRGPRRRPSRG